jgi:hypothetical protein
MLAQRDLFAKTRGDQQGRACQFAYFLQQVSKYIPIGENMQSMIRIRAKGNARASISIFFTNIS